MDEVSIAAILRGKVFLGLTGNRPATSRCRHAWGVLVLLMR